MTLIGGLLNRLGNSREETHHECRRCGRTLAREDAVCGNCGSEDVASFFL